MFQKSKPLIILALIIATVNLGMAAEGELKIVTKSSDSTRIGGVDVTVSSGDLEKTKTTSSSGEALFELEEGSYRIKASKSGYTSRAADVSVKGGSLTVKNLEFDRKIEKGEFTLKVESESGNALDGLVFLSGRDTDYLKSIEIEDGLATFDEVPNGRYNVFVNGEGYKAEQISVNIDEPVEKTVKLSKGKGTVSGTDLEIDQVVTPTYLRKGGSFFVAIKVFNQGKSAANNVEVLAYAFGQKTAYGGVDIEPGMSKWIVLKLDTPNTASGKEQIQVEVKGPDRDLLNTEARISDLKGTLNINPSPVEAGKAAYITGKVSHANLGTSAEGVKLNIYAGNDYVTSVKTDETGNFNSFVRVEKPGTYRISVRNSYFEMEEFLRVEPYIKISRFYAPNKVEWAEQAKACGTVEAPGDNNIVMYLNSGEERIETREVQVKGEKDFCFVLPTDEVGKKDFEVVASLGDKEDSASGSLAVEKIELLKKVLKVNKSVEMVSGKKGILKVNLTNPYNASREFKVSLGGVDEQWIEDATREVILDRRSTKTLEFAFKPGKAGNYNFTLSLGQTAPVGEASIDLEVKESDGVFKIIADSVSYGAGRITSSASANWEFVALVILIVALGGIIFQSTREENLPSSLEPRKRRNRNTRVLERRRTERKNV